MKRYFIVIDEEQKGPFSIEQIAEKNINKNTLVWNETFEDWIEAGKVEDFEYILKKSPPPIPKIGIEEKAVKVILTKEKVTKPKKDYSKTIESLFKLLLLSFVFGVIVYFISAFGVYDTTKFDNYNWSSVRYDGTTGWNFPLDEYSPDFYSSNCNPERINDCLKENIADRKQVISGMSFKNAIITSIIGYLILVFFYFVTREKSEEK
ncbi:DUF4339 domain-containing protein [Cellulophaga baltica 4]|nr:DUF4339 domain-containing protein [Cellulophaga baltica 4]